MKKTGKYIIIMLVVLALLGGAVAVLMNLPTDGEEEESSVPSSSQAGEALLELDEAKVDFIDISNAKSDFTIVPSETTEDGSVYFTLKDYEKYDLNTGLVTSNARSVINVTASKSLGARDDLEAFGLKGEDAAEVTVHCGSDSYSMTLGSSAPESTGRYVLMNGEVYIVSSVPANFYGSPFVYFNTEIYTIANRVEETVDEEGNKTETEGMDIMYNITFSGKQYPDPISIEYSAKSTSGYLVTEPITAESGNNGFSELVVNLKTLTAASISSVGDDQENLEAHGLLEPDAEIQFNLNNSEHRIAVSAKNSDGLRYMMVDDSDVIYLVENDTVAGWAESSLLGLRMSYIWIPNIKNVEKMTITLGGDAVYQFDVTRTLNEEKTTEQNTVYDLAIVDAGGNEVDYSETYQPFYQLLISMAVFSQDEVEVSGTPDMKVVYEYFDGGSDTLELYKMDDQNRYAAMLNGKFNGQVRGTQVDEVIEKIPQNS